MYARPDKASHLDTVRYEIDMLDYCFRRLAEEPTNGDRGERDVFLESFLLHYRNLIRFFSGLKKQKKDLVFQELESRAGKKLAQAEIKSLQNPSTRLDQRYHQEISRYLQRITTRRHLEPKGWNILQMYDELKPILTRFRELVSRGDQVAERRGALLGMFADEPGLMDEIVDSAMKARESHPLRPSGG